MLADCLVDHLGLTQALVEIRQHRLHERAQLLLCWACHQVRTAAGLGGQRVDLRGQRRELALRAFDHCAEVVRQVRIQSVRRRFERDLSLLAGGEQ